MQAKQIAILSDNQPVSTDEIVNPGMERDKPPVRTRHGRLVVVEPMVFIYLLAGFPMESIYSQYLYRRVGDSMGIDVDNLTSPNSSDCIIDMNDTGYLQREAVQAQTSLWSLYIDLAGFLPGIFAYLVFGSMSDRIGRKFIFILPPIGSLYKAALMAVIIKFNLPYWVFIFSAFEHLLGSFGLLQLASLAYLADTTSPKYLAVRMTILEVIIYLSGAISDLGVGFFIKATGYLWPTLFVCCGKILALLYAIFFIPETLTDRSVSKKIKCEDITRAWNIFKKDDGSGRLWKLRLITFAYFLLYCTHKRHGIRLVLMNAPLCWGSVFIGYFDGVDYGLKGLGNLAIAGMKGWAKITEEWLLVFAMISCFLEFCYIPLVRNTIMMFFTPLMGIVALSAQPMIRALLSRYARLDEHGALFAGLTIVKRTSQIVGEVEAGTMYAATILILQGRLVYVVSAVATLLSLLCIIVFMTKTREERRIRIRREKYEQPVESNEANNADSNGSTINS